MGQFVVEFVVQAVFEIGCYWTARLILPLLSLGSVRVGKFQAMPNSSFGPPAVQRMRNGPFEIRSDLASFIGFGIWMVMGIAVLVIAR